MWIITLTAAEVKTSHLTYTIILKPRSLGMKEDGRGTYCCLIFTLRLKNPDFLIAGTIVG